MILNSLICNEDDDDELSHHDDIDCNVGGREHEVNHMTTTTKTMTSSTSSTSY